MTSARPHDLSRSQCSFSLDGSTWLELGHPNVRYAPVEHEPGWDFFEVTGLSQCIHLRRSFPIRLVRIYSSWPSGEAVTTALHPGGLQELKMELPHSRDRWIVAVCPSNLALRGAELPAPAGRRAAAFAAAKAEDEAKDLEARAGALSGYLRHSSDTASTASSTPRNAVAILTQLYEDEVLGALRNGGDAALDEVTGVAARNAEIAKLKKELELERSSALEAQAQAHARQRELARLQEQMELLQQQLRRAERERMAQDMELRGLREDLRLRAGACGAEMLSWDEVVRHLAVLEARQLQVKGEEKAQVKRKLLLRWHPDKNSQAGGANDLAKRIMQELQVHPDWNE